MRRRSLCGFCLLEDRQKSVNRERKEACIMSRKICLRCVFSTCREVQRMHVIRVLLVCGLLFGPASSSTWAGGTPSLYDKPLRETHLPLPRDPSNPRNKPMLSCFYYLHFMVKQVDLGEEGAEQLSILHEVNGPAEPPCRRANAKDEIVIDPKAWGGYFEGAKGNFVFFHAEDAFNGGLGFAVFDGIRGKKLFEDEAELDKGIIKFAAIAVLKDPNSKSGTVIRLRYQRVYPAQCSLRADKGNCWKSIQRATGLKNTTPPNCAAAYEAEKKRSPEWADSVDSDPSVIAFDVEVVVAAKNTTVRVPIIQKAMECHPAE